VEIPFVILAAAFAGYIFISIRWLREHDRRLQTLSSHIGILMVWYDKSVHPKKVK
jgi:hypothetical protein